MAESPDAQALARLAKSGADLSMPQRLRFVLRFPSEDDAAAAVTQLDELAFSSTIEQDGEATWAVLATKRMYPVESDLVGLRDKLTTVARQNHGSYEGWQPSP